jgi:hypothetical protein
MPLGAQVLVNVVRVPSAGNLAPGDSTTIPHGLKLASRPGAGLVPDLIQPWSSTNIIVDAADELTATFTNLDTTPGFAFFRISYTHSISNDVVPVNAMYWQGQAAVGSCGIMELTGDVAAGPGCGSEVAIVEGIQGRPVSAAAPAASDVLEWNGSAWAPTALPTFPSALPPSGPASGDLSGTYPSPTVDALQGFAVAATAPAASQVLAWNGSAWAPTTPATSLPPSGPASGDLSGTYPSPTVDALQGFAVSAAAPAAGNALIWNGSAWTPTTPTDTGITQLTSDVTAGPGSGSQAASVVALRGFPVAAAAPVAGNVLLWNGAAWAPSAVPATPSLPRFGNTLVVDAVNGNNATASVNGTPFLTVEGAISYINTNALTGVTVWILPGTYALAAGITIPATCSLRGLSTQTTRLTLAGSNPGGTVTMVTMGENTRIEDLTLTLTSTNATTNLVGIALPGTTSVTSKLRTSVLTVNNATLAVGTTTNVYGILSNGAGTLGTSTFSFNFTRGCTINVLSNGGGNKRGILVSTANAVSFRDTNIYVAPPTNAASTGSYVGAETTDNAASAEFRSSAISGAATAGSYTGSDILQTLPVTGLLVGQGIQIGPGTDLVTRTAGAKSFTTFVTPSTLLYSLRGNSPSNAQYFWPGNQTTLDTTEIFYRFQQKAIVFGMNISMRVAPGAGKSIQFLVKKSTTGVAGSGVATIMTATVANAATTGNNYSVSVNFAQGEYLSLQLIPSASNSAADIVVELDLF